MNAPRTYTESPVRGWEGDQSRVLRNTYALLALSMLPTIAGAFVGIQMASTLVPIMMGSPIIVSLAIFGISWFLISVTDRHSNSKAGIGFLALFTAFCGFSISPLLAMLMKSPAGGQLVMLAAGATAGIFATMALLANFIRADVQKWVGFISVGFWVVLLVKVVSAFFIQNTALMQAGCAMAVILFSLWIFFDIRNVMSGAQGNYIRATLSLYLNLFNIFVNLLQLMLSFAGFSRND